jgi:hypothetical protein
MFWIIPEDIKDTGLQDQRRQEPFCQQQMREVPCRDKNREKENGPEGI